MSTSIMIHDITKVEVGDVHQLDGGAWVLVIRLKSHDVRFDIDLFADNREVFEKWV